MTEEEQELIDDCVKLFKSFTSNQFNKKLMWDLIVILEEEAEAHGDRAIIECENIFHRMKRACR